MVLTCFLALLAAATGGVSLTVDGPRDVAVVLVPVTGEGAIRRTLTGTAAALVDVPAGDWTVDVETPGVWHERQHVTVKAGTTVAVQVNVLPLAHVTGKAAFSSARVPAELLVRFEEARPVPPRLAGQIACPIDAGTFRCAMPAGTFNLRIRPRGFVGHYRADFALRGNQTHDLGTLEFREGQSITGRVELPREHQGNLSKVIVTASAVHTEPLAQVHARPERNGFFHVDGVAPGAYVVRAAYETKLYSDAVEVAVLAGREAELFETLVLAEPRRVRMNVGPSTTPSGAPWQVRLHRVAGERQLEMVTESNATRDGEWTSPPLQPNRYEISVGTSAGELWWRRAVVVQSEDLHVVTTVVPRSVRGEVRLGDRPLEAALTISGRSGFSVKAKSDEDGRFEVAIPSTDDTRWNVDVRAELPTVRRRLSLQAPSDDRILTVALPANILAGSVVDSNGTPVSGALVNIIRGDSVEVALQTRTAHDGAFAAHGLAHGSYSLVASDFLAESEPHRVDLREDETSEPIRLTLQKMRELRGRVVSDAGPVAGASVEALAVDADQRMTSRRPTNINGEFTVAVPAGARRFELNVAAPGFAFVITSAALTDRPLLVNAHQRGGSLVLRAGKGDALYLVHNGATATVRTIEDSWATRTTPLDSGAYEITIPMMQAGAYSACVVRLRDAFRRSGGHTGGRCVSGFLAPLGTLMLDVR